MAVTNDSRIACHSITFMKQALLGAWKEPWTNARNYHNRPYLLREFRNSQIVGTYTYFFPNPDFPDFYINQPFSNFIVHLPIQSSWCKYSYQDGFPICTVSYNCPSNCLLQGAGILFNVD